MNASSDRKRNLSTMLEFEATSAGFLGHHANLGAYEKYPEGPAKAFARPLRHRGLVRLVIGLEAVEDLVADLDALLTTAYGPR